MAKVEAILDICGCEASVAATTTGAPSFSSIVISDSDRLLLRTVSPFVMLTATVDVVDEGGGNKPFSANNFFFRRSFMACLDFFVRKKLIFFLLLQSMCQ